MTYDEILNIIISRDVFTTVAPSIVDQADDIDEAYSAMTNPSPRALHLREVLWDSDGENPELEDELEGYEHREVINFWVISGSLYESIEGLDGPCFYTKQDLCIFVNHDSSLYENDWLNAVALQRMSTFQNAVGNV